VIMPGNGAVDNENEEEDEPDKEWYFFLIFENIIPTM
jgi:hypothetical protein